MRINPKDSIAGVPIVKVREFLRWARGTPWTAEQAEYRLADRLGIDHQLVEGFIHELERRELVEQAPEFRAGPELYYQTTIEGNALAMATAGKPITRRTAERLVNEFLERVKEVNADDYYLYKVVRVVVFGSYLEPEKEALSDLDLAIDLAPKEGDQEKLKALWHARSKDAHAKGRRFQNLLEYVSWPQTEVKLFLRSRSRAISLHDGNAERQIWENSKHKTIFPV